jgi:hypothetical protein
MKHVEVVIFINHLEKTQNVIGVLTSLSKAEQCCMKYSKNNPEYGLKKNQKNKRHWISDSYNYNLKIVKTPLDDI